MSVETWMARLHDRLRLRGEAQQVALRLTETVCATLGKYPRALRPHIIRALLGDLTVVQREVESEVESGAGGES